VPGSLRAEILAADALPAGTYSTLKFQIPATGLQAIALQSQLPVITNPVNLHGLSQQGSSAASPLVQIDGANAGSGAGGLNIEPSASCTATKPTEVGGLEITDFCGGGVNVNHASYVKLNDLFIGVTKQGNGFRDQGNGRFGVLFAAGSHDTLSSSVVAANQNTDVYLGAASSDTLTGDFIGTDVTGESSVDQNGHSLGNTGNGVLICSGANHNTVTKTVVANTNGQCVELTDQESSTTRSRSTQASGSGSRRPGQRPGSRSWRVPVRRPEPRAGPLGRPADPGPGPATTAGRGAS
jgi:hypothetical protein